MLGKLLKYDLRGAFRLFPILLCGGAGVYFIGLLVKVLDITQLQITMSFFLGVLAVVAVAASFVMLIVQFYKGMFGVQGYLTQTLPVSAGNLILSKLIAAVLMLLASFVTAFLAIIAILHLNGLDFDVFEFINKYLLGSQAVPLLVYYLASLVISFFLFAAEVYFSIALAHTRPFIKHSGVFAVILYFALNTALSFFDMIAMLFIPLGIKIGENGISLTNSGTFSSFTSSFGNTDYIESSMEFTLGVGNLFTQIAATVALFILTNWLIERKTSIK